MSQASVQEVIRRAVRDTAFRSEMFADPAAALIGYELDEAELAGLRAMPPEQFDALSGELDRRVSMSMLAPKVCSGKSCSGDRA